MEDEKRIFPGGGMVWKKQKNSLSDKNMVR